MQFVSFTVLHPLKRGLNELFRIEDKHYPYIVVLLLLYTTVFRGSKEREVCLF